MATYQDGNFPSGAPILTTAAGVAFKCNSFQVAKAAETTNITDNDGAHAGALSFAGPRRFTAEVQFANNAIAEPTTAAANATQGVFINVNIDQANVNCFVDSVTVNKPQRGPWTAQVAGQARVN